MSLTGNFVESKAGAPATPGGIGFVSSVAAQADKGGGRLFMIRNLVAALFSVLAIVPADATPVGVVRPDGGHSRLVIEAGFSCDGRHLCRQMRSCAEARYFLEVCGVSRLDGDGDGVPCETLCGSH